ncbi:MAG TPA: flavodoxin domain-containing protein [Anaerolineaceae bacterium]|jgi:menaquinone-dependent protoporphyrinogen oxidase|nr:flavodoxin domain-containing protein [Anaerolineaceae bacterium]
MTDTILVVYATRYGSTREAAEKIGEVLRENGLQAEVHPARNIHSLEPYRAAVLSAPVFVGSLQKDIKRFLAQYKEALAGMPVAFFALGPLDASAEMQGAVDQLDKELAKFPWLKLVSKAMFGGKYDPAVLRFPDSFLAKPKFSPLYKRPASDTRDWEAIKDWALSLAETLQ